MRVIAVTILALLVGGLAHAEPRPPELAPIPTADSVSADDDTELRPKTTTRWYGWQIIVSDLLSTALVPGARGAGAIGYLVGPAIIHAAHGNYGRAVAAPALRAGLALGGGALAVAAEDSGGEADLYAALAGGALGLLAAAIVDWTWSSKTVELPGTISVGQCQGPTPCNTVGFAMRW